MPRFVILRHATPAGYARPTHFDLMFEWGDALRTWAATEFPAPGIEACAQELAPHRLAYLDYEGEVAGDRGSVTRVAWGEYELVESSPAVVQVHLRGASIFGILQLSRTEAETSLWKLLFSPGPRAHT
ncbi:MAG: hypothetical protein L0211_01985 [Planctomycetaceae bacterium]|nr:hypothetical protein [Planctomycetaceae bacterium]